jgi:hypothetical protein
MSEQEYEQIYQNALRTLDLFGARVGTPFTRNGQRFCAVNGAAKDDQEVFFLTWGRERAKRINDTRRAVASGRAA